MKARVLLVGVLLAGGVASGLVAEDVIPLPESWVLGFLPLEVEGDTGTLGTVIPQLLAQELEGVRAHLFSSAELRAYSAYQRDLLIRRLLAERVKKVAERDEILFDPDPLVRWETLASKKKEIRELDRRIARIGRLPDVAVDRVPVEVYRDDAGLPFLPEGRTLEERMEKAGVDLVVRGEGRVAEGYLVVHLVLKWRYGPDVLWEGRYVGGVDELVDVVRKAADDLAPHLLGVRPARLVVEVPEGVQVFVDGEVAGMGRVEVGRLLPGEHRVEVRGRGVEPWEAVVTIGEGEERVVEVPIREVPERLVQVSTVPGGASVYLDGVYQGASPCEVRMRGGVGVLEVRKEGYLPVRAPVASIEGDAVEWVLSPVGIDLKERVRVKRERFYTWFGLFFMSVPLTVLSYGWWADSYEAAELALSRGAANADDYLERMDVAAGCYYAGVVLNVSLFVQAVLAFGDYLRALERVPE
ncbi:PEGA domain-containing protein [Spirochaeta thermophila]|uniref:PEGA domain-containing protein n=1 Tax=Winmispira thermophila (strain ATCC 49972 / DSM 6192 / RI 19.B1) TaxID=665571 RepID=E0RTF6_WINT6|nr:PEGA domain-containing protein [Spirochaeta thermophila]ADN02187.1 hypothetical protein STHERM_c12460 [Spirochaeta thermophila DSM 6192]